jgi:hypothetical protein
MLLRMSSRQTSFEASAYPRRRRRIRVVQTESEQVAQLGAPKPHEEGEDLVLPVVGAGKAVAVVGIIVVGGA